MNEYKLCEYCTISLNHMLIGQELKDEITSITEITTAAVQLTLFFPLARWTALIIFARRFWPTGLCITRYGIPINLFLSVEFCTAIGRAWTGHLLCLTIIPARSGDAIIALQTVTLNENRQQGDIFFCSLFLCTTRPNDAQRGAQKMLNEYGTVLNQYFDCECERI